jgi:hypothetical protein
MTAGGFQLSLRCQPEPVFIQALHCPYSDAIPKSTQLVSLQEQIGDKYLPKMKFSWKRFGYVEPTRWHRYNNKL